MHPIKYNSHKGVSLAIIGLLLISSCKKNDDLKTNDLLIYSASGSTAYNVIENTFSVARNVIQSSPNTGFPILLTRPFGSAVQVSAQIDTSLLAAYDSLYKTTSPRFPTGVFSLVNNGSITIPQGKTASSDSVTVQIADASRIDFSMNYVIPVKLISSGSGVPLSSNRQTMYMKLSFRHITTSLPTVSSNKTMSVTINRTPVGDVITPDITSFGAAMNGPLSNNLAVTVVPDNSLVAAYNSKNGTVYGILPEGSFSLVKSSVTIPATKMASTDSFQLRLTKPASYETGKTYLLPLTIKDEGPVAPDPRNNAVYIAVNVIAQNIDLANTRPQGAAIDRIGWTATASATDMGFSTANPSFTYDGNYATGWQASLFSSAITEFLVDMKASHKMNGIAISPMYWDYSGYPFVSGVTAMKIATSMDGINWTAQGNYTGTAMKGTPAAPDIRYIKFYAPVQARYFKFSITGYDNSYAPGFSEINVFE